MLLDLVVELSLDAVELVVLVVLFVGDDYHFHVLQFHVIELQQNLLLNYWHLFLFTNSLLFEFQELKNLFITFILFFFFFLLSPV